LLETEVLEGEELYSFLDQTQASTNLIK
jgi:hypothetical protein